MIARAGKTSATLIVNPASGRLAAAERDEVALWLSEHYRLETITTTARDAAIGLARDAGESGTDVVVAFGGDGHINEVVNGLAGSPTPLGIIPGGTMNVFARALGIPLDPRRAVNHLIAASAGEPRSVPLGLMDDRYFTFSAGCGFDAEAAARVESHLSSKRRFGELFFYWSAARVLAGSYRHRSPAMVLEGPFGRMPVAMAIACNCGPYAYLLGRAVRVAPDVKLEAGLDVFALKTMRIEQLPLYAWHAAISGNLVDHPDALYERDLNEFSISASEPFARHTDGEPLEPATAARFSISPDGVLVYA